MGLCTALRRESLEGHEIMSSRTWARPGIHKDEVGRRNPGGIINETFLTAAACFSLIGRSGFGLGFAPCYLVTTQLRNAFTTSITTAYMANPVIKQKVRHLLAGRHSGYLRGKDGMMDAKPATP